jgi:UDP-N-acetyl-D-mannosaminuronic acid dehydrogenase
MPFQRISVVGLGYVGLPTAALFAARKFNVVGVDANESVVATVNNGRVHFVEPELDILVHAAVSEGYLRASTIPEPADAFLIAVPTPFLVDTSGDAPQPDMHYIQAAAQEIAPVLKRGDLVVLESTVPVGTTEQIAAWLAEVRKDLTFPQTHGETSDIRVAHCPERVLPGRALHELVHNDRVIGGMTSKCGAVAVELYREVVAGECIATDCRTAEMVKLAENCYRDVNIALANELSIISHKFGIDVWELIRLANLHPRVNILQPGPGVGGHCIAVDPWFIVSKAPKEARLIRMAREINDAKPGWVLERINAAIALFLAENPQTSAADLTLACYGLSYKPDIDDLRGSAALRILGELCATTPAQIVVVEPHAEALPSGLGHARLADLEEALKTANLHAVLVGHTVFRNSAPLRAVKPLDFCGVFAGSK